MIDVWKVTFSSCLKSEEFPKLEELSRTLHFHDLPRVSILLNFLEFWKRNQTRNYWNSSFFEHYFIDRNCDIIRTWWWNDRREKYSYSNAKSHIVRCEHSATMKELAQCPVSDFINSQPNRFHQFIERIIFEVWLNSYS
jgi:hypothetical protein